MSTYREQSPTPGNCALGRPSSLGIQADILFIITPRRTHVLDHLSLLPGRRCPKACKYTVESVVQDLNRQVGENKVYKTFKKAMIQLR